MNKERSEVVAIVDENDKQVGTTTREEAHKKGVLHREAYVIIINSKKEIILQKRKDNKLWDFSSSGHVAFSESYERGAQRELKEEIGVSVEQDELQEIAYKRLETIKPNKINKRFVKVFLIRKDVPMTDLRLQKEEVIEVRYFDKEGVMELIFDEHKLTTNTCKKIIKEFILEML